MAFLDFFSKKFKFAIIISNPLIRTALPKAFVTYFNHSFSIPDEYRRSINEVGLSKTIKFIFSKSFSLELFELTLTLYYLHVVWWYSKNLLTFSFACSKLVWDVIFAVLHHLLRAICDLRLLHILDQSTIGL